MRKWYEIMFDNYGKNYDKETFTVGTIGECDFIEQEMEFNKSLKILDIGCGTGRHAIELATRGYNVTGIDLSDSLLEIAREKAKDLKLKVDFLKHDARDLPFVDDFDMAIMICEGAFPLMETDEMNFEILKCATNALKSKGKFIFTTLNGLFPLVNSVEDFCNETSDEGNARYEDNHFDFITFRDYNTTTVFDDNGKETSLECNERYYIPPEITNMLKSLGYHKIDFFGAKLGAFSRDDILTSSDFEMLVIAER